MKILKDKCILMVSVICGIAIVIIALFSFLGDINGAKANSVMMLIAGILQIIIGYNFATKNKKIESIIFYCISVAIFGLFIVSII